MLRMMGKHAYRWPEDNARIGVADQVRMPLAQSRWASLPTEIWDVILSHLKPALKSKRLWQARDSLKDLPHLSAVCTKFRAIFAQLLHLHSVLYLPVTPGAYDVPAIISHVQQHQDCLHTVLADCNPHLDSALVSLLSLRCPIRTAFLAQVHTTDIPQSSIALLAEFTTLTACILNTDATYKIAKNSSAPLSLLPFCNLPHLELLELFSGNFEHLDSAMHLTSLTLDWCNTTCSEECKSLSSLVQLSALNSSIKNFHRQGLSACSALMSLSCEDAYISAHDPADTLCLDSIVDGDAEVCMPASLSKLTSLTSVTFDARLYAAHLQLSWLNSLSALHDVSITMNASRIDLPSFDNLTRLSSLQLANHASKGKMQLNSSLAGLVALESLSLKGPVEYGQDLGKLVDLHRLESVDVSGFSSNTVAVAEVAVVAGKLAVHRLDVSFLVEHHKVQ